LTLAVKISIQIQTKLKIYYGEFNKKKLSK